MDVVDLNLVLGDVQLLHAKDVPILRGGARILARPKSALRSNKIEVFIVAAAIEQIQALHLTEIGAVVPFRLARIPRTSADASQPLLDLRLLQVAHQLTIFGLHLLELSERPLHEQLVQ